MKKLKLNLDELKVESFSVNILNKTKGTINGNATLQGIVTCDLEGCPTSVTSPCNETVPQYSCAETCGDDYTCDYQTCVGSCGGYSCQATCGGTCFGATCDDPNCA